MAGSRAAAGLGQGGAEGSHSDLLLIRYGEVGLKGQNRSYFLAKLRRNLRRCLRENGVAGTVWQEGQRIFVGTEQGEAALDAVRRVFGVVSISPVLRVPAALDEMQRAAVRMAHSAGLGPGSSFFVRARRGDKSFALTSPEIGREVGAAVVEATGAKVRFSGEPDLEIGVELRHGYALLSGQTVAGPGGMPAGSGGRVVALVSTGIDSPVAMWLMMKRGCSVIPVHFCSSAEQAGRFRSILAILQRYSYGWKLQPVVLAHEEVLAPSLELLREVHGQRWTCLICKRQMLAKAAEVAEQVGASAIVTGDSLGQVASQTLANIEVVSSGITKPIFRPLIGLDKTEIMAIARQIGTYDASVEEEYACPFLPNKPITQGKLPKLEALLAQMRELAEARPVGPCAVGSEAVGPESGPGRATGVEGS